MIIFQVAIFIAIELDRLMMQELLIQIEDCIDLSGEIDDELSGTASIKK